MNLNIGINRITNDYKILLEQIGISYTEITNRDLYKEKQSVIILNGNIHQNEIDGYKSYVEQGGVLITTATFAKQYFCIEKNNRYLKYINLFEDEKFYYSEFCDLYYSTSIASNANYLPDQNGKSTLLIEPMGKGLLYVLPDGFTSRILEVNSLRKNFITMLGEKYPNEKISRVGKGQILFVLRKILEDAYRFRNLPFVHKWFFPGTNKNIFNYRIDTDFGKYDQFKKLYEVLDRNKIKGTWFFETSSIEDKHELIKSFENQEIAIHCYRHKISNRVEENNLDIKKSEEILKLLNYLPEGYAAPFGEWNKELNFALEQNEIIYSSEFSLSYDNFPFFPQISDDKYSKVLQISIHPLSPVGIVQGRIAEDKVFEYFKSRIDKNLSLIEPLFFYTHPLEERFDVVEQIFKYIESKKIENMTMLDYAKWWKRRLSNTLQVELTDDRIIIDSNNNSDDHTLRVLYPNGKSILALQTNGELIKLTDIEFEEIEKQSAYNSIEDYKELRKYSLRLFKRDLLFHYWKIKL